MTGSLKTEDIQDAALPEVSQIRHASAVAIDGQAVLIEGPSGSGKSALALELMALGGELIADDIVRLRSHEGWPWAFAPEQYSGVIEARGVGLIRVPFRRAAPVRMLVDMGCSTSRRLPEPTTVALLGQDILQLRRVDATYFSSAIVVLMHGGLFHDV